MASLIRRFVQEKPLGFDVDDEFNVEYSFAMEYNGPAVSYSIPRVDPVNVDHIPVAARVSTHEVRNLALPVVQPIVKIDFLENRLSKLELEEDVSLIPVTHSNELEVARVLDFSKSRRTAFRVVNVIDTSGELEFSESDECIPRILKEYGSSGTLGFSDSHDISRDLSESSDTECLQEDYNDSGASSTGYELDVGKSNVKKGSCHRCFVKRRFMEKEACIVCNAKYCSNCVIRAMGSMPEGRKCSTCIGLRIDESKRASLGKSSRMLRRLLTESGVKQIMSHEVSCEVNQVPPELVILNGKPLCRAELVQLLGCPNPPRKLKPRKYWYDKQSGLWGLEGEKPCQIITPQLDVGDPIMQNASNGKTNILVNNREITKPELWVMQLAGIHCEGQPHYWCSADGSFQEVGQKNVIERIWFKPKVKLLSSVLSLPTPLEPASSGQEEARRVGIEGVPSNLEQKTSYKLLMVGYDKSGTSTIFKQAKFLYKVPFSNDERQSLKHMIQSNLYRYIGILLEERERFEVEAINEMRIKSINQPDPSDTLNSDQIEKTNMYSISRRLQAFSDWLLQVMMSGNLEAVFPASTREYAPLVEELWKDRAFQATFDRRNEIQMLPRVANYFLNRAVEISRTDYEPSDMDILYAEGISSSNSIASVDFSFPKSINDNYLDASHQDNPSQRYQLVRIHSSSLGKKCKWLEMFEDTDLIIYCVSLTDYDEYSYDISGVSTNKMMESKKLFETIVTHPVCHQKNFLLILNKFDLLEEKIEQVPLTQCEWFHDFNPVQSSSNSSSSRNPIAPLAQRAFHYIAAKFKQQFKALTGNKLYVSRVTGLESDSVDEALKYGTEVLKWNYEKPSFNINDWTDSIETSTFS
ncbi:Extra-large guanine nucleotide-binding protein 1 [Heracleum sosnowskyi]|uniref:Extra-large guanine nucleotide-binding protein 1 n=1 Tax=Heracleum sosnowskyi TaxID=360622 RepID=A0AAD8J140_9APIA|nr:Extra-large guanine nucleotide-binding protein 1 [Heracleum sosnowskyi]